MNYKRNIRKWTALLLAVVCYFLIHEGAHWIYAMYSGAFKQMNFIAFGVQVDIYRESLSDLQLGIFCLVGPIATIIAGYVLYAMTQRFLRIRSQYFQAFTYYLTIAFLLIDPLYLCVLTLFVGGGDMNGIVLIMPELFVRVLMGIVATLNLFIVIKSVLPKYKKAYDENQL